MDALYDGDFEEAQIRFRESCKKTKSYQAFNNIGIFYFENGMICKNGKTISGEAIGKRFLQRSLTMRESEITLQTLGHIEYDSKNLKSALILFEKAYGITRDPKILYNIAAIKYDLGDYKAAFDICDSLIDTVFLAKLLFVFSKLRIISKLEKSFISEAEALLFEVNEPYSEDNELYKIDFYYAIGDYEKVLKMPSEYERKHYGLSNGDVARVLDSYMRCGKTKEGIKLFREYYGGYDPKYTRHEMRKIYLMCDDTEYMSKILAETGFSPTPIKDHCPYFGCTVHNTPW